MKHADPAQLRTLIADAIRGSRLADRFRTLTLDTQQVDEDYEFLRVNIQVSDIEKISDGDLDALTESIEGAITPYDDRFPSIRFSDA